ncbi:MAG: gamma-glutamyltransferase [Rhodospirillales bacterium]|nr:gamma-glutamyltransferase [Rhodospirillales bacterium]
MTVPGAVAAGHPETCRAAVDILNAGGNAVDAALAAMAVACIAEPALASLGGGGFLLSAMASGRHAGTRVVHDFFVNTPGQRPPRPDAIDFRPVHAEFGATRQEFHIGRAAIAVPGIVRGLFAAHRDLGRMPIAAVVEPAVRCARDGVPLAPAQADILAIIDAIIGATPAARALFASPDRPGARIGAGERLRWPRLADVLETLAIEGDELFYRGEIARQIVADASAGGATLSLDDFARYRVEHRPPLTRRACGAEILLNPPPASGGVLLALALALIDDRRLAGHGFATAAALDETIAVMAAAQQARLDAGEGGDEEAAALDRLCDPALIALWRRRIAGRPRALRGTTHISVVDGEGNAAALSLSNGEGSAYVVPGTDIMMNNMLGEDDLAPRGFHRWQPATRMTSMMAPTLVTTAAGERIALGSGGSNRIRTAMLQVLVNHLVFGLPLADAIAAPRLHYEADALSIEPGFAEAELARLLAAHPSAVVWPALSMFFGGVHAAARSGAGRFIAAADARRGGAAHAG